MKVGDVVQFNQNHEWYGAFGIIYKKKLLENGTVKFLVGVPIPLRGVAYIHVNSQEIAIERIGEARLILDTDEGEEDNE